MLILVLFSLDVLLLSSVGLFAEIRRVKFRKDRVKMQIWGDYITRFRMHARIDGVASYPGSSPAGEEPGYKAIDGARA